MRNSHVISAAATNIRLLHLLHLMVFTAVAHCLQQQQQSHKQQELIHEGQGHLAKCCGEGEAFLQQQQQQQQQASCVAWNGSDAYPLGKILESPDEYVPEALNTVNMRRPKCVGKKILLLNSESSFEFLVDFTTAATAQLYSVSGDDYHHADFCVERMIDNALEYLGVTAELCRAPEKEDSVPMPVMPYLFATSALFLLLAVIKVFFRNRQKLVGFMTLCLLATLFLFYSLLTVTHFLGEEHVSENPVVCQIQGFALQFLYLSAVAWLNCLCYVIWRSFRRIRHVQNQEVNFKMCVVWALGFPSIVTVVTLIAHLLPAEHPSLSSLVRPDMGSSSCFLGSRSATFFYFHLVSGPCLLFNLAGFVVTAFNLCCGIWSKKDLSHAGTVVKMFVAMGVPWVAEFTSGSLGFFFEDVGWVRDASLAFDAVNALQGVFLFAALMLDAAAVAVLCQLWDSWNGSGGEPAFQARYRLRSLEDETDTTLIEQGTEAKAVLVMLTSPVRKTYSYEVTPQQK